ncbi:MAG: DUF2975 domain-containing protein [Bacteroidales bacterium]|jgi:hypothetical protein|nr:DUF2975 domain-containing protein [Bacteroidales bacterium]
MIAAGRRSVSKPGNERVVHFLEGLNWVVWKFDKPERGKEEELSEQKDGKPEVVKNGKKKRFTWDSSITGNLNAILRIARIFTIIGVIGALTFTIYAFVSPGKISMGSFTDFKTMYKLDHVEGIECLDELVKDTEDLQIRTIPYCEVFMHGKSRTFVGFYWVLRLLCAFLYLVIVQQLLKLVESTQRDEPFAGSNSRRIRLIGYSVVGISLIRVIVFNAMSYIYSNMLTANGLALETQRYFSLRTEGTIFFLGLLVLVLANVFRKAVEMKEEQSLTI